MKYCNHCGAMVKDEARYCPECGTPCSGFVAKNAPYPPKEYGGSTPAGKNASGKNASGKKESPKSTPYGRGTGYGGGYGGKSGPSKAVWIFVGVAVAVVAALAILAAAYLLREEEEPDSGRDAASDSTWLETWEPEAEAGTALLPEEDAADSEPEPEPEPELNEADTPQAEPDESGEEDNPAEPEPVAEDTALDDSYIFPQSASAYLTDADLAGLDKTTLRLARNEIVARHGRLFRDEDLQAYFNSKSWYVGTIAPDDYDRLTNIYNSYEAANIELIKQYESY